MARIRTIKPEFWTDERLSECSLIARLLLIAALNFADDYGNLDRSARQLKGQAFPHDDINCDALISELLRAGSLIEYKVADSLYLHIKNFEKHQLINRKSAARLPSYVESLRTPIQDSEPSMSPPVALMPVREGKGEGSKAKNRIGAEKPATNKRGALIPDDWALTPALREFASDNGLDPEQTADHFKAHWGAASGGTAYKRNWNYAFRTWCWKALEIQKQNAPRTNGHNTAPPAQRDAAAWAEARAAAKAIGFREPYPAQTPTSYMQDVKTARDTPPKFSLSQLQARAQR